MTELRHPGSVAMARVVEGAWRASEMADPDGFADAVDVALAIERRAEKTALVGDDVRRYQLAVRAIARHARRNESVAMLGADEVAALARVAPTIGGRVARSFHPPWTLAENAKGLAAVEGPAADCAAALLRVIDGATARNAGYVITVEPGHLVLSDAPRDLEDNRLRRASPQPDVADALTAGSRAGDRVFAENSKSLAAMGRLRGLTSDVVRAGEPLPVGSNARHDVLTEVLRELHGSQVPRGSLRILYVDSSEPAPFPVGDFGWRAASAGGTVRLGLMSMRHTKLDLDVDGYWFRNRMVSLPRTLAETDADCTEQSITFLDQLSDHGVTQVELVHTGFEPAVIGCYRAIAQRLADPVRPPIRVQPYYTHGDDLVAGTAWGTVEGDGPRE